MCQLCRDGYDPEEDYEGDDEPDMDERWSDFYNWLEEKAGWEWADLVSVPRGEAAETDEAERFFTDIASSWRSDFENAIDTDGVLDAKRRTATRREDQINSDSAVNNMDDHDMMVAVVDMGLYRGKPLDVNSARAALVEVGIDMHEFLWSKARQYETANYDVYTL
jgi:hypothetical protein